MTKEVPSLLHQRIQLGTRPSIKLERFLEMVKGPAKAKKWRSQFTEIVEYANLPKGKQISRPNGEELARNVFYQKRGEEG